MAKVRCWQQIKLSGAWLRCSLHRYHGGEHLGWLGDWPVYWRYKASCNRTLETLAQGLGAKLIWVQRKAAP